LKKIAQNHRINVAVSSSIPVYGMLKLGTHGGSTMSAVAEVLSTVAHSPDPRGSDLPTCPVCADSMVAAEASAFLTDNVISYLWTCDTCGYGFVTKHALKRIACN
jgi:hypothetical protein